MVEVDRGHGRVALQTVHGEPLALGVLLLMARHPLETRAAVDTVSLLGRLDRDLVIAVTQAFLPSFIVLARLSDHGT